MPQLALPLQLDAQRDFNNVVAATTGRNYNYNHNFYINNNYYNYYH